MLSGDNRDHVCRTSRSLKTFHDHWLAFNHDAYAKVKGDTNYPITHLWQAMENGTMSEKEVCPSIPSPHACTRINVVNSSF